jgi:hypothetical protein
MTTYDITLTDPLKLGFQIQPGAFDGPGGTNSNTSLRLYGRGALEWGESVDENLVRLTETFAGATPPLNPLPGQLWARIKYYVHDTSRSSSAGWYVFDPNDKEWSLLNGSGIVPTSQPTDPVIGSYYFDVIQDKLFRWDSAYKQAPAAWLMRSHSAYNTSGIVPQDTPVVNLLVWDTFRYPPLGRWVPPQTTIVQTIQPNDPQPGDLWYDHEITGLLHVWNGTSWKLILGPSAGGGTLSISGPLDMQNNAILNLATGAVALGVTQVVSGGAVYDYINSTLSSASFVRLAGAGTITSGMLNITTPASANPVLRVTNGKTELVDLTCSSTITCTSSIQGLSWITNAGGHINANYLPIINVPTPTQPQDGANKTYVDTSISTALSSGVGGLTTSMSAIATGGAFKAGDIAIYGGKIYIANIAGTGWPPQAGWKQVHPAVYA